MAAKSKTAPVKAKAAKKVSCVICFEDIDSDLMFSVDNCGHRFCFNCVKQHIEVKLLDGKIPNCLHHRCKSQLFIDRCDMLLNPKLRKMWKQRVREDTIPFRDRVYCPYKRCSYLMTKTELYRPITSSKSGLRRCFKCRYSFCVHCKVPWHSPLSWTDYKKLHPYHQNENTKLESLANREGWRQCGKCNHIVELSWGCNIITCRCGNVFCYTCGGEWNNMSHRSCTTYRSGNRDPEAFIMVVVVIMFVLILYMV